MTPSTWLTVATFFLFVAPGLLYDLLSARRRVERRESTFREVSRVALVSTGCMTVAFLLVTAVSLGFPQMLVDPAQMIRGGSSYIADEFQHVVVAGCAIVGVALLVSYGTFLCLHRKQEARITYASAWKLSIRDDAPRGTEPYVRVKLLDGTVWFGKVARYSPDLEVADRELVLAPPMATKRAGEDIRPLPDRWQRVILTGSQIVSVSVGYQNRSL